MLPHVLLRSLIRVHPRNPRLQPSVQRYCRPVVSSPVVSHSSVTSVASCKKSQILLPPNHTKEAKFQGRNPEPFWQLFVCFVGPQPIRTTDDTDSDLQKETKPTKQEAVETFVYEIILTVMFRSESLFLRGLCCLL